MQAKCLSRAEAPLGHGTGKFNGAEMQDLHLKCGICSGPSGPNPHRAPARDGGDERAPAHQEEARWQTKLIKEAPGGAMTQREAMRRLRRLRPSAALGLLLLSPVLTAPSYSVLTHEATWDYLG